MDAVFDRAQVPHVVDKDRVVELPDSLDATLPLFKARRIPGKVEIDQCAQATGALHAPCPNCHEAHIETVMIRQVPGGVPRYFIRCPTPVCCTPSRITAVITGVNVCSCVPRTNGVGGFLGAAKLVNPPTIDGTYVLTQSPFSPCRWTFFKNIASTIEYYAASDCTGSPTGGASFPVIEFALVRQTAALWALQIGDGCQTFFGANGFDCIGASTFLAATANNCKVIGTFNNQITGCCAGGLSLCGQWATGGTATLEACA